MNEGLKLRHSLHISAAQRDTVNVVKQTNKNKDEGHPLHMDSIDCLTEHRGKLRPPVTLTKLIFSYLSHRGIRAQTELCKVVVNLCLFYCFCFVVWMDLLGRF